MKSKVVIGPGLTRVPLPVTDENGDSFCAWCGEAINRKTSTHYFAKHNVREALEGEHCDFVVIE
jgi:hypothetical protein